MKNTNVTHSQSAQLLNGLVEAVQYVQKWGDAKTMTEMLSQLRLFCSKKKKILSHLQQ